MFGDLFTIIKVENVDKKMNDLIKKSKKNVLLENEKNILNKTVYQNKPLMENQ